MSITQQDLDDTAAYIDSSLLVIENPIEYARAVSSFDFEIQAALNKIYGLARQVRFQTQGSSLSVPTEVKTAASAILAGTITPADPTWTKGNALYRTAEVRKASSP